MILVPVKNLENAKQRLSPVLDAAQRFALAEAMLHDVLHTLAGCSRRQDVAVVTSDPRAHALAKQLSFQVIEDAANASETHAIEMATRVCRERGAASTLVIPGDIPLIQVSEVEKIFAAAEEAAEGAVLVPSASGRGTNAAYRSPADLFPLRFGNDSFLPHLAAAQATGSPVAVLRLPGIALDVDEPGDLADLLAAPGETRSQCLLRGWNVADRLLSANRE